MRYHALQHGDRIVTIDYCDVTSTISMVLLVVGFLLSTPDKKRCHDVGSSSASSVTTQRHSTTSSRLLHDVLHFCTTTPISSCTWPVFCGYADALNWSLVLMT